MKKTTIQALTIMAAGALFSGTAAADCAGPKILQKTRSAESHGKPAAWPQVGPLAGQTDAGPSGKTSITGLWLTTFYSGGQVVDQGFDIWHDDGTEVLNDTPPPATGNVCLGVWEKNGHTYKLKHPSWTFDSDGNLNGTAIIREQVALLPGGDSFAGNFTVDVYDLAGNLVFHLDGTVAANRITAD